MMHDQLPPKSPRWHSFVRLFHFLGGVRFALILIALSALMVAIGTFLESQTASHLFAVEWTYGHPFFALLLSLFFINILLAALRRWPFQKRHIPFLITHLGLLMVIGGTFLKNCLGLQGRLTVWEGSGSSALLLPHTYALAIEEGDHTPHPRQKQVLPINSFKPATYRPFPQLTCQLVAYAPHVTEILEGWIKGEEAYISGFPPLPVHPWAPPALFPKNIVYVHSSKGNWSLLALRTARVQEAMQQAYLQGVTLRLKDRQKQEQCLELDLLEAINQPFAFGSGTLTVALDFGLDDQHSMPSALMFAWQPEGDGPVWRWRLPLQGPEALWLTTTSDGPLEPFFSADLIRSHPALCIVEDEDKRTFLGFFDLYGRMHQQVFHQAELQAAGSGLRAVVPHPDMPCGREHKAQAAAYALEQELRHTLSRDPPLCAPFRLLAAACHQAGLDLAETFVAFLTDWHRQGHILYHTDAPPERLSRALQHLDWQEISPDDRTACLWVHHLLVQLERSIRAGHDPLRELEQHGWPWLEELRPLLVSGRAPFNLLARQMALLAPCLPTMELPAHLSLGMQASLLAAYFRIHDLDYRAVFCSQENGLERFDYLEEYWKAAHPDAVAPPALVLETPVTRRIMPEAAPKKLEERRPGMILEVAQGNMKQRVAVAYDHSGMGIKWPVLGGRYLLRFQPISHTLPYRVRLRQARQIPYPDSAQIYSYESDVVIADGRHAPIATTLSMNQVYQTWDGYRFYLSGIGTSADASLKRVQLAVNYDPSKYVLTYPGGLLVLLGILWLFWVRPYK